MIRNIMGTLIYVGLGRQQPDWVDQLLAQRDRRLAAPTFAADGLYLAGVDYPEHPELPVVSVAERMHSLTGITIENGRI